MIFTPRHQPRFISQPAKSGLWLGLFTIAICFTHPLHAAPPAPRIATRVFFQDDDSRLLKWADLLLTTNELKLGPVSRVDGFPTLDGKRQSLVQMEAARGKILIGVRDDDDGHFQSGWALIDTGVDEEEHESHSHWDYVRPPRVLASVLDDKQGNPAHLYCYDEVFYLANDKLNGFTRLDPEGVTAATDPATVKSRAVFHAGGGGHITLAAIGGSVGYSTWIDREGINKGRVDVAALRSDGAGQVRYSLSLPAGGIHGATACQGKVFFAPSHGICWLTADTQLQTDPQQVKIHHLSLGKDGDNPRRTGAFTTFGSHVAFNSGAGSRAEVGFMDATKPAIQIHRVPINMAEGNRPTGLEIVQPRKGSPLAFVFHDHSADVSAPNRLSLIETDPNQDGDWTDAKVALETDVGPARGEGHAGHHSVTFDADRRRAIFTNPGDATLVVIALDERRPVATFQIGGVPSKVIAVGGRADSH